ncbi:ABC transporter DrrB family efflux protein [Williamsia limnetica]|jgi:ABC-2 type transport system permease protein|uniref:Transport permease protein n=1 Tax=Williamsia limnetica TaxID=882452 RepID=A0A318RHC2_WILLI|nr:ABC transporter permease [Williamsia limnetica]PYE12589.1 ABC transporter DrrB family efflux protein [Williamsia limnetica]
MNDVSMIDVRTRTGTVRAGWIIASRDLAHWRRDPWTPIFGLAFSIMLLLVFGFLFGGAISIPGVDDSDRADYIDFLVPGMLALSMMFGVETTTAAMAADAKKGITDRFRSMPIGNVAVALGRVGADMVNSVVELTVLIIGGLLIGWTIGSDPASAALAVVLLLALRFSLLWVGIFLGLTFPSESATSAVQVLVWPIGFLSTAIVGAETMPGWLGAIAAWNPISATATAARELFANPTGVTGGPLDEWTIALAIIWPAAISVVFIALSARAYRRLRR